MQLKHLFTDRRAISPVVGVALLIAIAVILATVIGFVVLDLGPGGAGAPQTDVAANYATSGSTNYLLVNHRGGDPLVDEEIVLMDENGNTYALSNENVGSDGKLTGGETVNITGSEFTGVSNADEITVVWEAPNGDKTVVIERIQP